MSLVGVYIMMIGQITFLNSDQRSSASVHRIYITDGSISP